MSGLKTYKVTITRTSGIFRLFGRSKVVIQTKTIRVKAWDMQEATKIAEERYEQI